MYQIVYEPHCVYEFAAEELSNYYAAITGDVLLRYTTKQTQGTPIYLGSPGWIKAVSGVCPPVEQLRYDGYWLLSCEKHILISGKEPRSILYGVYRLLEDAGCKWMFPGSHGQIIPQIPSLTFAPNEIIDNPDFEIRTSTDDTRMEQLPDSYVVETMEKFDWAIKNRLNTYFLSGVGPFHGDTFLQPLILREIAKRGLQLEVGGHSTWQYVRRELFETNPELFREVDGQRRPDGNFCSSNPEAVEMVVEGIGQLVKKLPSVSCVHLWFEDVFDGAWCECPKCRHLSSAQQMMNVIKAVANRYPELHVDFILYHDSGDISTLTEKLPPNISAYYAPRERCYTHRISDPNCRRNQEYYKQLTDAADKFAAIYPFEYYTDMILFNKMGTNLQKTLCEDMQDYKALGVNAITLLMFNRYSWFAYKLNMATFARAAWRLNTDYMALRQEFCHTYFKGSQDAMMAYYDLQEQATELLLEFCGYDDVHDIRNIIPLNPEFSRKHLDDLTRAQELYRQMDRLLLQALTKEKDVSVRYLLNCEKIILSITRRTASVTYRLMDARHRQAFESMPQPEYDAVMDELIAENEALAELGRQLPDSLVGINGKTIFPDHLCGDLNLFYRSMKSKEEAKEFKTF